MRTGTVKTICFLFSFFIFFHTVYTGLHAYPDIKEDWYSVKGKVISLEISEIANAKSTLVADNRFIPRGKIVFNERWGKKKEQIHYDKQGNFQWKSVYTYTENGNLSEWSSFNKNDHLKWKYIYSYDDKTNLIKLVQLNGSEKIETTTVYQYENGRLVEELVYNSAGLLQWAKRYTYYSERIIEWSTYYPDGNRIKKVREIYNPASMKIREIHSDELGSIYEDVHFVYNDNRQLTELRIYDGFGRLKELRNMEYNSQGDLIRESKDFYFEDRKAEYIYSYTYDLRSNWIEKITEHYVTYEEDEKELVSVTRLRRDIVYDESFRKE